MYTVLQYSTVQYDYETDRKQGWGSVSVIRPCGRRAKPFRLRPLYHPHVLGYVGQRGEEAAILYIICILIILWVLCSK